MEFFERAHVSPKDNSKMEKKSDGAVKKQLKKMLNAYKRGNNQEIKSSADTKPGSDIDDTTDFSDIIFHKKPDNPKETVSSPTSQELQTSSYHTSSFSSLEHSSSKSRATESECSESSLSITEYGEEVKSITSPENESSIDPDLSSTFNSSVISDECSYSEMSLPSSLKSSSSGSEESSDEAFDPDGALAAKILEKLGKKGDENKKRKLTKDDICPESSFKKEKKKDDKILKEISSKQLAKKESKKEVSKSNKEMIQDIAFKVLDMSDGTELSYRDIETEMSEGSLHEVDYFEDTQASDNSEQYISVSVSDMESQSFNDVIGDYVHPTARNLPSEKKNYVQSIEEDYKSDPHLRDLIPEPDEELAIEDLTLETDPEEQIVEDTAHDETGQTDYELRQSDGETEQTNDEVENINPTVNVAVYGSESNRILVFRHPTELYVHGKVLVSAIQGSVDIYGYNLQNESTYLYAPYCYFAHCIKTIEKTSASQHDLFKHILSVGFKATDANEIVSNTTEEDTVIAMRKLSSPRMDFVDNNFPTAELFTKRIDQTQKSQNKVIEMSGCSIYLQEPKRVLEVKKNWEKFVARGADKESKGIICGGKGTGKSTLLRYAVNKLLSATNGPVVVIDLDPGQSEFAVPGNISVTIVDSPLIGPNFTHLKKTKLHNIGMINVMEDFTRYITAVKGLIAYCHFNQEYYGMPWIVNTMGMCNNLGLKIICLIILALRPTHVYQIDSKKAKSRFGCLLQPQAVKKFYKEHLTEKVFSSIRKADNLEYMFILQSCEDSLSPGKVNGSALSPKAERYLNVLAYFGQLAEIYGKNILEIVPYEVDLRDISVGSNLRIPKEALTKVINGKIVALCEHLPSNKGKIFTLGNYTVLCHGYGLVRGIDFEKNLLYILTPVPIEVLKVVNTVLYADWMPELGGQEKDLPDGIAVPYRSANISQQKSFMFSPRRRFNPIHLLKATRTA